MFKYVSKLQKIVFKVTLAFNTDLSTIKTKFWLFFAFSIGISRAEKWRKKYKENDILAIYPGDKCEI